MIQKTKGIVLHTIKYGDTSLIAHMYTEDSGRHSFLFKGIRSSRSKMQGNILQPLFVLNIEAYIKENKDLSLVKEISAYKMFRHFPYDEKKNTQALFMAEILYRCLKEHESNKPLFNFILNSIEYFDFLEVNPSNFHIIFLVKLSKYLGFYPSSKSGKNEIIFDMQEGTYKEYIPSHFDYIDPYYSALLNDILNTNYEQLGELKMNQKMRNDLCDSILKFYSFHIEGITKLKSYSVLRELFI